MDSLKKYNFKDDHGHPLENCQDYIDLIHRASSAESSLAAMRQRAERAESRSERAEEALFEIEQSISLPILTIEHAESVFNDIGKRINSVFAPLPAAAGKMGGGQPDDPYSGELGNINLRNLAAQMHAALGLLKRQGCYHPAMDSMREEGFRFGLNLVDHSEDNLNMVGKRDTEIDDPNDPFELDD